MAATGNLQRRYDWQKAHYKFLTSIFTTTTKIEFKAPRFQFSVGVITSRKKKTAYYAPKLGLYIERSRRWSTIKLKTQQNMFLPTKQFRFGSQSTLWAVIVEINISGVRISTTLTKFKLESLIVDGSTISFRFISVLPEWIEWNPTAEEWSISLLSSLEEVSLCERESKKQKNSWFDMSASCSVHLAFPLLFQTKE